LSQHERQREEEWFLQNERELLEQARAARLKREAERRARETEEERKRLKESHWMRCPKCGHPLKTEDLDGVEIDRCTMCDGFFMDAGELEQLFLLKEGAQRQGIVRRLLGI
jgi:acetyl-CoA carboxylase beta subunit